MGEAVQAASSIVDAGALQKRDGAFASLEFTHVAVQAQGLHQLSSHWIDRVERGHRLLENHGNAVAANGPHLRPV